MAHELRVLGVLQNTWVRDPARVEAMIAREPTKRRRILAIILFAGGSPTGRRLRAALGNWCERIEWENADPTITDRPAAHVRGDVAHLEKALDEVKPSIVITFGAIAYKTLTQTMWRGHLICGPHPTARVAGVAGNLSSVRAELDRLTV